jgi:hypothetical protein
VLWSDPSCRHEAGVGVGEAAEIELGPTEFDDG